jgi:4-carboxymuconolactone decarboxylase
VSDQEAQQYLDDMVSERGYVLEYHKRLIGADYEFARAVNDIVDAAYLKERRLDRRTKAGVVAFQEGFNAWAEVVGAPALEPTVDVAGNRNNNKEED